MLMIVINKFKIVDTYSCIVRYNFKCLIAMGPQIAKLFKRFGCAMYTINKKIKSQM